MATVDPLAIALQFIDGCRDNDWETARAAMHDDMVHVSPTDQIEGADKFIAYYRENFGGNGWTYEPCLSGYHPHPLYVVCTHFPE